MDLQILLAFLEREWARAGVTGEGGGVGGGSIGITCFNVGMNIQNARGRQQLHRRRDALAWAGVGTGPVRAAGGGAHNHGVDFDLVRLVSAEPFHWVAFANLARPGAPRPHFVPVRVVVAKPFHRTR